MLITVPGKKELNNYDGRYGYYRSETTDFVLLQNPNISLSEWWSSIYGKQNNFRFIEIYSSIDSVDYLAEEKSLIEKSIYESTGIKYGTRPLIKDLNNVLDEKKIINKKYFKYENRDYTRYEIKYGEYPTNVADSIISAELEYHFYNKELTKTGKEYFYSILKKIKKLEEYIYKGKKYVRMIPEITSVYDRKLSNGKKINKGEAYWIEVTPIKWLLSNISSDALSKDVICYVPTYATKSCFDCFYATDIYEFLNSTFKKDIIPSKVPNNYYGKEEVQDTRIEELEKLLKEIEEYNKYYYGDKDILKEVDNIIDNYNSNLEDLKGKKGLLLYDEDVLYREVYNKLNGILDILKQNYQDSKTYIDILNMIRNYIKIVRNLETEEDSELSKDIKTIKHILSTYLPEYKKVEDTLLKIFKEDHYKLYNYLKEYTKGPINRLEENKYQSVNNYELYIRKVLMPLLEEINRLIIAKDFSEEIRLGINNIINNIYEESKNKLAKIYLNEIYRVSSYIKTTDIQNKYKDRLNKIITLDIDYTKEIIEIINNLNNILRELYKLTYEIESIKVNDRKIEKYKLKKRNIK